MKKGIILFLVVAVLAFFFYLSPRVTAIPDAFSDDGGERSMAASTEATLMDIWGSSSSDVFAVGSYGLILHYDGSTWSKMGSDTNTILRAVWGSSCSDVFAVGSGPTTLHYDGKTWSKMPSGAILHYDGHSWSTMSSGATETLRAVWGSSSSDVFAVGGEGTILHYDGDTWSTMSSGTTEHLSGLWGISSSDVFAVGSEGTILHYDGKTWREMRSGTTGGLCGIWGSSSLDVFAVGERGTILHYDGSRWSTMISGTGYILHGVWGSSSTDVFAVGSEDGKRRMILHYDGKTWGKMRSGYPTYLKGVWGSSSSDVFAVGSGGTILHYDGKSWSYHEEEKLWTGSPIWQGVASGVVLLLFGFVLCIRKWKIAFWLSWLVLGAASNLVGPAWWELMNSGTGPQWVPYFQAFPLSLFLTLIVWLYFRAFRGPVRYTKGWLTAFFVNCVPGGALYGFIVFLSFELLWVGRLSGYAAFESYGFTQVFLWVSEAAALFFLCSQVIFAFFAFRTRSNESSKSMDDQV